MVSHKNGKPSFTKKGNRFFAFYRLFALPVIWCRQVTFQETVRTFRSGRFSIIKSACTHFATYIKRNLPTSFSARHGPAGVWPSCNSWGVLLTKLID